MGRDLPSALQILLLSLGTSVKLLWSWYLVPVVDLKLQGNRLVTPCCESSDIFILDCVLALCSLLAWWQCLRVCVVVPSGAFFAGAAGLESLCFQRVSGWRGAHQKWVMPASRPDPSILPFSHSQLTLQHQQAKLGGPWHLPVKINPTGMWCLTMGGVKISSCCSNAPPALCKQWCLKC